MLGEKYTIKAGVIDDHLFCSSQFEEVGRDNVTTFASGQVALGAFATTVAFDYVAVYAVAD